MNCKNKECIYNKNGKECRKTGVLMKGIKECCYEDVKIKLYYGYHGECQHELDIAEDKQNIKECIDDLMQIYDWVVVVDDTGKDITCEYC